MMLKLAGGIFVAVASFMNGYLARAEPESEDRTASAASTGAGAAAK